MRIRDLTYKGYANQIPGRHVFRIDERVISGNCFDDESMITITLNILICDIKISGSKNVYLSKQEGIRRKFIILKPFKVFIVICLLFEDFYTE